MVSQIKTINVLMVCLGNICRSPMAEAVLKHQISERSSLKGRFQINVDSAGTGAYHEGDDADDRTIETCRKHNVPISCRARKVVNNDYEKFDYILAMDNSNLQNLLYRKPSSSRAHISLFGAFDPALHVTDSRKSASNISSSTTNATAKPKAQPIADPYYGGASGFEQCYWQCAKFASGFLDYLENGEKWDVEQNQDQGVSDQVRDVMGL